MDKYCLYVTFFLSVYLLIPFSEQTENFSIILEKLIKNISPLGFETQRFRVENRSFYDSKCDCGFGSSGCKYVDDKKICNCDWQYSQNGDKCERCYCGIFSGKCFFENNKKICSCFGKYKQNSRDECEECDCGLYSSKCEFSGYSKVCTCDYNYIPIRGNCEKCDCGPFATSCELTYDKYTRCTCDPGYVAERRSWESDETCKLPGPSGWKIATYIESVIFGLIFIVCITSFCCNRNSS